MRKTLIVLLIVGFLIPFGMGCNKYEYGGLKRRAEKNLTKNIWKLDKYYRNGADETSTLMISSYTEDFKTDNTMVRSFIDSNGDPQSQTGTWQFDTEKIQINLAGLGSFQLSQLAGTIDPIMYIIKKLKKNDFWYFYTINGDTHEFRMVTK